MLGVLVRREDRVEHGLDDAVARKSEAGFSGGQLGQGGSPNASTLAAANSSTTQAQTSGIRVKITVEMTGCLM